MYGDTNVASFSSSRSKSDCHLTAQHFSYLLKCSQVSQPPIRSPSSLRFLQTITPYPASTPPLFRLRTPSCTKAPPPAVDLKQINKNVLFKLWLWSCNLARETGRYAGNFLQQLLYLTLSRKMPRSSTPPSGISNHVRQAR